MRSFIRHTALILVILILFSLTAFAELETGNNLDLGNSTGIVVPFPSDEKENEQQAPSSGGNQSYGGGSSNSSSTKTENTEEAQQESSQTEPGMNVFDDVKQDDWFYGDVMFVFDNKIMTGTGKSEFSPGTSLNRAMMITILHRIDGDNIRYEKNRFNDVEKNSWYENAVNWGFENKIINGISESSFAPMNNLTREQLCVMLYNYTKFIGVKTELADISAYSDSNTVSDWAKDAVSWAVREKIVTGKGNNFLAPKDSATRAEAAAVIRRYIEKNPGIKEK